MPNVKAVSNYLITPLANWTAWLVSRSSHHSQQTKLDSITNSGNFPKDNLWKNETHCIIGEFMKKEIWTQRCARFLDLEYVFFFQHGMHQGQDV